MALLAGRDTCCLHDGAKRLVDDVARIRRVSRRTVLLLRAHLLDRLDAAGGHALLLLDGFLDLLLDVVLFFDVLLLVALGQVAIPLVLVAAHDLLVGRARRCGRPSSPDIGGRAPQAVADLAQRAATQQGVSAAFDAAGDGGGGAAIVEVLVCAEHEDVRARRAVACRAALRIAVLLVAHAAPALVARCHLGIVQKVVIVGLLGVVLGGAHRDGVVGVVGVDALPRGRPDLLAVAPDALRELQRLLLTLQQDLALDVLRRGLAELERLVDGVLAVAQRQLALLLGAPVCRHDPVPLQFKFELAERILAPTLS